jgi:hypothetical protein
VTAQLAGDISHQLTFTDAGRPPQEHGTTSAEGFEQAFVGLG